MKLRFQTDRGMGPKGLGLIVLPADETLENEMRAILPRDGVALYHSRIAMPPQVSPQTLGAMEAALPEAVAMLPARPLDVIGYGCTSGATMIGPARVAEIIRAVHPEARVTDPLSAVMAACHRFGWRRLAFVTPYVAEVSAAMRKALEDDGLQIAGFGSFLEDDDRIVARITTESILDAIEAVAGAAPCDAVFVSCTNLRVAEIAALAEARIGRPVLSSNLAMAWHMMTLAGVSLAPSGPMPHLLEALS